MSKLTIDQRTILNLLGDSHTDFLIPDYQRPYAWGEEECRALWDDLLMFACPDYNYADFDEKTNEYFLGAIVTFKNPDGKQEIIDGQQRLTTVMLLLRAWYDRFTTGRDPQTKNTLANIAKCLWRIGEDGQPDRNSLKIDSLVAGDNDKGEFLEILRKGLDNDKWKSVYANNYRLFMSWIEDLVRTCPSLVQFLVNRTLNNVILLPIEAEDQETALRIFSGMNDRGLPLSDADIFKSKLYKFYSDNKDKEQFVSRWRELEQVAKAAFRRQRNSPMDELFTRYMYYERAKQGIKATTTPSLRSFYSQNNYSLLKQTEIMGQLEKLAAFWQRVEAQEGFSAEVAKDLFVLRYGPNGMWTYILSVWFLTYSDDKGNLNEVALHDFLRRITAFILAHAVERPGVNALRTPIFPEMVNIVNRQPVTFNGNRKDPDSIRANFTSFEFTNGRPVTKSILTWWAFRNPEQGVIPMNTTLEIEHIYARRRASDFPLKKKSNLDALGNKSVLEEAINIRAADYRFEDKKRYYLGFDSDSKHHAQTAVQELLDLAQTHTDFTEADIEARTAQIIDAFMAELDAEGLLTTADAE